MNRKKLIWLYYLAWLIGIVAAGFLIYGIIKSLI